LIWAASRGLLLVTGIWAHHHRPSGRDLQSGNLQRDGEGPALLEIWARWDSEWYLLIAAEGYHLEGRLSGRRVAYGPADATGFFPLYPLLVGGLGGLLARAPGLGRVLDRGEAGSPRRPPAGRAEAALLLAGVVISNAALLGSILLLHERASGAGRGGAPPGGAPGASPGRAALMSCAALLFFPPSIFLSAVYAESLLLFLTLLGFKLLRDGRWLAAAAAGALASATKPAGILLVVPAAMAIFGASGAGPRGKGRAGSPLRWATLALYPAGAVGFSAYCWGAFGDPLVWLRRQERWRGALSGPWRAFVRWAEEPRFHGAHGSTVELVFALLALALLVGVARRRPRAEAALTALVVVPPLCSTLWSFGRLSLQAFPLFIVLGGWAARRPWASLAYFVPAAAASAGLMAWFAAWWWAG
jgi:hypothetical protein